jgi:PIN domain
LSKLVELAQQGHLRLLVTDVTVREVKSQLREVLAEAHASLIKHGGILQQLGASVAIDHIRDQTTALITLEAAFDQFLQHTKAVNVPLISEVSGVLDDYFARRAPFSTKKKSEFPDAISIASVRLWCEQTHSTAYIVSEDPDLRACCSEAGPLFHADSITEIISQATVSQELHQALEKALRASEYLRDWLAEKIKDSGVVIEGSSSFRGMGASLAGKIDRVHSVNLTSVNVLDQREQTFTCELEVEAEVAVNIDVEFPSRYGMDYEPPTYRSVYRSKIAYFYSEVVVRFDRSTGELEFDSIYVSGNVEIGIDDVM